MARSVSDRNREDIEVLKDALMSAFSTAKAFKFSYEQLKDYLGKHVWDSREMKRLPQWARSEVRGFSSACHKYIYRDLEWKLNYRGKYVHKEEVLPGIWSEVQGGKYFWIGTDKEY